MLSKLEDAHKECQAIKTVSDKEVGAALGRLRSAVNVFGNQQRPITIPDSELAMLVGFYFNDLDPGYKEIHERIRAFYATLLKSIDTHLLSEPGRKALSKETFDAHQQLKASCDAFQVAVAARAKDFL